MIVRLSCRNLGNRSASSPMESTTVSASQILARLRTGLVVQFKKAVGKIEKRANKSIAKSISTQVLR